MLYLVSRFLNYNNHLARIYDAMIPYNINIYYYDYNSYILREEGVCLCFHDCVPFRI